MRVDNVRDVEKMQWEPIHLASCNDIWGACEQLAICPESELRPFSDSIGGMQHLLIKFKNKN